MVAGVLIARTLLEGYLAGVARNTRTYTVLVCDFCGVEEDDVENRKFELDGKRRQLESCPSCWEVATVKELLDTGRQTRRTAKK